MVEVSGSLVVFSVSGNIPAKFYFQGLDLLVYGVVVEVINRLGVSKIFALA
jgi:hypothetical protein